MSLAKLGAFAVAAFEAVAEGIAVEERVLMADAAAESIVGFASSGKFDLIAMATHGHRLISDLIHGTTITKVRHESAVPLFLVKAEMN